MVNRLLPGIRRVEKAVLAGLSADEQTQLLALLGEVLAGAAGLAAQPPIVLDGRRNRPPRLA